MCRTAEDFLAKVDRAGDCWMWLASVNKTSRYGQVNFKGRIMRAHAAAYLLFVGPIPAGMELDHRCHSQDLSCPGGSDCPHRRCVNPGHLEPVTHLENMSRSRHPGSEALRTNRCIRGHEFTAENTRIRNSGSRVCKECARQRCRRYRARDAA